ncbi:MAG: DUF4215 domain-containing protein [Myxococcales bacterium]
MRVLRLMAAVVCTLAVACSSSPGDEFARGSSSDPSTRTNHPHGSGQLSAALTLPDDSEVGSLHYIITGPANFTRTGSVPVQNSSKLAFRVGNLPVQGGYTLAVTATTSFGEPCNASVPFALLDNKATSVSVLLVCQASDNQADLIVNGDFKSCPLVTSLQALPSLVAFGATMQFEAWLSHGVSSIAWTSSQGVYPSAGSFSSPVTTGPLHQTAFTCSMHGLITITASVTGLAGCTDSFSMQVECEDYHGCGDGNATGIEQCDTPGTPNDKCTEDCRWNVCGDGIVFTGVEECDDGNAVENDGCTTQCKAATTTSTCGDGIVQVGEACDDGNHVNNDACPNNCMPIECGDAVVQSGEQCDDGNAVANDGCTNTCRLPACGDGILQAGEECDDGNAIDYDDCSNSCLAVTVIMCPVVGSIDAIPLEILLGHTLQLTAYVFGDDPNATVEWFGEGGTFSPQVGLSTGWTCTQRGFHDVTAVLSGVVPECMYSSSETITVECN